MKRATTRGGNSRDREQGGTQSIYSPGFLLSKELAKYIR